MKNLLIHVIPIFLSSTNKTDRHDIIEILLKVALNTIIQSIINRFLVHKIQITSIFQVTAKIVSSFQIISIRVKVYSSLKDSKKNYLLSNIVYSYQI